MPMARRLRWYLNDRGIDYDVLPHLRTQTSLQTAHQAHVAADKLAKCVLLEDERGYLMAILPASRRIAFDKLDADLDRHLELATEKELVQLFRDCAVGAVPPIGEAYNVRTLIDDSLLGCDEVYFEAGDHEDLVHVDGDGFRALMLGARRGSFTRPAH